MRKLVYVAGISLDGFLAGPDGEVDFMPVTDDVVEVLARDFAETLPSHVRQALGVTNPPTRFDTVLMGRGTYEPALAEGITDPYAHLTTYVVSTSLRSSDPAVTVVADDPLGLVRQLKAQDGGDLYLAGGGVLAGALLGEIDELLLKTYPVLAGAGRPLLDIGFAPVGMSLTASQRLRGGTIVSTYSRT